MRPVWEKLPLQRFYSRFIRLLLGKERRVEFLNRLGWSSSQDYMIWWFRKLGIPVYYVNRFLEPEVFQEIRNLKGGIAVDIGAHVGSYTKLFSENFERVYAFEPDHKCIMNLLKIIDGNVVPYEMAISNKTGVQSFYKYPHSGHNSLLPWKGNGVVDKATTISLDDFLDHERFREVDLVKVDVEGGEWLVLEGAENVMHKINAWVVEIHKERDKERALRFFQDRGYKAKWLKPNHVYAWRNDKK